MKPRYSIYNTAIRKWFSGFDVGGNQRWAGENESKPYDSKVLAEAQADIFGAGNARYFRKAP